MASRSRRFIVSCALVALLSLGPLAVSALGWSNGPSRNGVPGNGYGTHDWILDQAVVLAGSEGAWLDASTARLHTDDPDYKPKSDQLNHIYNLTRTGSGGPQTIADLYHKAVVAYQAGDTQLASKYVGQLSHYYADICQPYHTYRNDLSRRTANEHRRYELAVDRSHDGPSDVRGWISPASRRSVGDVRRRAVAAALSSRKDYPALKAAFRARGYSSSTKTTVGKITRRSTSRAANDLADIIASIPSGAGLAAAPRIAYVRPSQRTPRRTANVALRVKLVDADGRAIRGARVRYTWKIGSRTIRYATYTGANGVATSWRSMRGAPKGKRITVKVSTVTNSVESTASTSLVPR